MSQISQLLTLKLIEGTSSQNQVSTDEMNKLKMIVEDKIKIRHNNPSLTLPDTMCVRNLT